VPMIAGMMSMIDALNDRARDRAAINALVENKVESLRSISFVGLADGTTDFTNELPASVGAPRSATYTISSANTALKQVDVVVTFSDHGESRTMSYKTYIGELGVGQY
ncbi:MAG TPA: hypothetical protein VFT87_03695, partial [Candidatus Saccharimonadales bacterium]|nr:hypothetical protein [Candidatus Saccharimonadales bacterium]